MLCKHQGDLYLEQLRHTYTYITETKNKPYLTPKPYELIQREQLIGNIKWAHEFFWEGQENTFTWYIDRSNPKIQLPKEYMGSAIYENGQLSLYIKEDGQNIMSMVLNPVSYY